MGAKIAGSTVPRPRKLCQTDSFELQLKAGIEERAWRYEYDWSEATDIKALPYSILQRLFDSLDFPLRLR